MENMKTKKIKLNKEQIDPSAIAEAGLILKAGGVVAFPTETVYGLGANALDGEAAAKTYEAKGRPSDNPLIVHIAEFDALYEIVETLPEKTKELSDRFWPGPLTLIFRKKACVPYGTTGGLETVAVRMPDHPIALELIRAGGGYVSAPSANTSGRPSPTTADHVSTDMDGKIEMIIDGGAVEIGVESTIVDMTVTPPMILRPGAITLEMLEEVLGEAAMDQGLEEAAGTPPKAPGMKYRHYAPKANLMVVEGEPLEAVKAIRQIAYEQERLGYKVGIISTTETENQYSVGVVKNVGSREHDHTIAKNLYRILREFDEEDVEYIYSESFRTGEYGEAIMNRLLKAAGQHTIQAKEITRLQKYRKILFVSNDDNCRGPMAAELLKQQPLLQEYQIESRGLVVLFPEPPNQKAEAIMRSGMMTLEGYEAQQLQEEEADEETLILTMEEAQKRKLILEYTHAGHIFTLGEYVGDGGDIETVHGQPLTAYGEMYEKLRHVTKLLADKLNKEAKNI